MVIDSLLFISLFIIQNMILMYYFKLNPYSEPGV